MKLRAITLILLVCYAYQGIGQNFNKNDFLKADYEVLSGNFEGAQYIYERLLRSAPDNANLNFLNGLCLINIPGRKHEALPYLAKAAPKASEDYKYGSPKEENAPLEALKHYGKALMIEGEINKAIEILTRYQSSLPKKERKEIELAGELLEACYSTQRLQAVPVHYLAVDQGATLSTDNQIKHLVVSKDETLMFFSQAGRYGKDEILFSKKADGAWSSPKKITSMLGLNGECYPSSISADNMRLYLTEKKGEMLEISVSEYRKGKWQRVKSFGKPINGKDRNSDAFESDDGQYLYFSSDRKGSVGGLDIFRAPKLGEAEWGEPENIGNVINHAKDERMLLVRNDVLYFLSDGHENMGGYDVFVSEKNYSGEWNPPANLGYPLNSADDDIGISPLGDQIYAYAAVKGYGANAPWAVQRLEIFSEKHPRQFTIFGTLSLEDGESPGSVLIELFNTADYSVVHSVNPDPSSGWYSLTVPPGSYMINYSGPQYKLQSQMAEFAMDSPVNSQSFNIVLAREEILAEELTTTETPVETYPEETTSAYSESAYSEPVYTEPAASFETAADTYQRPATESYSYSGTVSGKYTIQFMATLEPVNMEYVLGKYKVEVQRGADSYYRYTTGVFDRFNDGKKLQRELIAASYPTAYIRLYDINDYLNTAVKERGASYTVQFFASKQRAASTRLSEMDNMRETHGDDGWYRYTSGEFESIDAAINEQQRLISMGYSKAYVRRISSIPNYNK